jgi:hypothetical protein
MGDRASIELVYPREGSKGERSIWLYTHWGATDLPTTLFDVLDKRERWDDESYLARMIASAIFDNAGIHDSTGAGISPEYTDGVAWQVHLGDHTVTQPGNWRDERATGKTYTFEEFLAASKDPEHSFEYGEDD